MNDRMIGYRLKRLDGLIEQTFDRLLAEAGLSRRQWQVLNVLSRGACDDERLGEELRPFWDGGDETVAGVVGELAGRGWLGDGPRRAARAHRGRQERPRGGRGAGGRHQDADERGRERRGVRGDHGRAPADGRQPGVLGHPALTAADR
ncbi:MarR family transcriptional regulator [Nonomuraea dietziae]|uniref:MarR family transcriptional regulator n=1 Tax=Nonomuraea dietziae TaxID=65515 RepID=UPI0031D56A42